jgi:hypothetical protein
VRITRQLRCDQCAKVREFEQPPCRDGHGADCDEWVCATCGGALLVASFPPVLLLRRRRNPMRRAA